MGKFCACCPELRTKRRFSLVSSATHATLIMVFCTENLTERPTLHHPHRTDRRRRATCSLSSTIEPRVSFNGSSRLIRVGYIPCPSKFSGASTGFVMTGGLLRPMSGSIQSSEHHRKTDLATDVPSAAVLCVPLPARRSRMPCGPEGHFCKNRCEMFALRSETIVQLSTIRWFTSHADDFVSEQLPEPS